MSEPQYLTASMLTEAMEEDVKEYLLPDDPNVRVRVRSVSVARMKQYQEAAQKGGSVERRAQAALIADSIIEPDGRPTFTADQLYNAIGKVRSRRFMALVRIVSNHNGGDDEAKLVEETEKNSGQTE